MGTPAQRKTQSVISGISDSCGETKATVSLTGRHAYDAKGVAKRGRLTQAGWEGAGGP